LFGTPSFAFLFRDFFYFIGYIDFRAGIVTKGVLKESCVTLKEEKKVCPLLSWVRA